MESHNSLQPCCLLGRTTRYKECESSKDNLLAPVSPRHQKPDLESVEGNARISKNFASDEVLTGFLFEQKVEGGKMVICHYRWGCRSGNESGRW